jgi:hypothetical protein
VSDWKIAPPIPSIAPNSTAAIATGSRHSRTIMAVNSSPPPSSVPNTSAAVSG